MDVTSTSGTTGSAPTGSGFGVDLSGRVIDQQ